jgi:hypothetical protein
MSTPSHSLRLIRRAPPPRTWVVRADDRILHVAVLIEPAATAVEPWRASQGGIILEGTVVAAETLPQVMRESDQVRNTRPFVPWIVAAIGLAICLVAVWIM